VRSALRRGAGRLPILQAYREQAHRRKIEPLIRIEIEHQVVGFLDIFELRFSRRLTAARVAGLGARRYKLSKKSF
jgi:hypothetical protein